MRSHRRSQSDVEAAGDRAMMSNVASDSSQWHYFQDEDGKIALLSPTQSVMTSSAALSTVRGDEMIL